MLRSFNPAQLWKDPRSVLQAIAGTLLALNLVAGWFVLRPLGGSASDLEAEAANLRSQLAQRRGVLQRTRLNVTKVEGARTQGDQFMEGYFLSRRTAATTILAELNAAAREAKIRPKLSSYNEEPIEGSDVLSMLVITGEYEGTYRDLLAFVNRIDRSPRLLIIESLQATPQQGSAGILNVGVKIDAFVREDSGLPVKLEASKDEIAPAAETGAVAPAQTRASGTPAPEPQPPQAPPQQKPAPAVVMNPAAPPPAPVQAGPQDPFANDTERPSALRRRRPRPGDEQ